MFGAEKQYVGGVVEEEGPFPRIKYIPPYIYT